LGVELFIFLLFIYLFIIYLLFIYLFIIETSETESWLYFPCR